MYKNNKYDQIIGQKLREKRIAKKMSLADAGRIFGCSRYTIFNYEKGTRGMPIEILFKMFRFYDIDGNDFINEVISEAGD